ncbi:MAG: hypothetical protein IJ786_02765 [Bacteroidaceae bacterium]|nr:hypothetical protein [Bacteroidaceae bacterium]
MEIILNPKYQRLHSVLERLEEIFPTGELVQDSFNEIRLLHCEGLTLNVKRYGRSISRRLRFYKMAKGMRAFVAGRYLRERGYDSPEPVAFVRYRGRMMTRATYFVTIQSPLRHNISELAAWTLQEQESIIDALAAYTARLNEDGFVHHNFKGKHILFDRNEQGAWVFALIDVNRVHRRRHGISTERGLKSFERLVLPEGMLERLTRAYARLRQYSEESAWTFVQARFQAYQEKVARRGR